MLIITNANARQERTGQEQSVSTVLSAKCSTQQQRTVNARLEPGGLGTLAARSSPAQMAESGTSSASDANAQQEQNGTELSASEEKSVSEDHTGAMSPTTASAQTATL